ncbi:hypothetical protein [Halorarum salinum]|uniref:Uncharacterized protein n=1 Tax=Halorarum salinum TaxID=2743089 RepID=A0A7D5QB64_9EURY|nr:hypothetical protein [Halobaculum salinum]QLG62917.1 hypothetical protein HUG12_14735 [Halobaculum salinum]
MVSTRFYGLISTVLLVVGALLVGQGFHLSLVTGEIALASPAFALHLVLGSVLIALGYRARRPVAEAYDLTSGDAGEGEASRREPDRGDGTPRSGEDAEFDPSMSPLGEAAPGDAERERGGRPDGESTPDERDERSGRAPRDGTAADEP